MTGSIEITPEDPSLLVKRGLCFRSMKNYPAAVSDMLIAIRLSNGIYPEAEAQLAATLLEIGKTLQLYVVIRGNTNLIMHILSFINPSHFSILYSDLNFSSALSYFTEAIKWCKKSDVYIARGDCYFSVNQIDP